MSPNTTTTMTNHDDKSRPQQIESIISLERSLEVLERRMTWREDYCLLIPEAIMEEEVVVFVISYERKNSQLTVTVI